MATYQDDKKYERNLYCTIDGVKTPVVCVNAYNPRNASQGFLDNVIITADRRLVKQQSLKQGKTVLNKITQQETTTTTTPQGTTTTTQTVTINPLCYFDFSRSVREVSGKVSRWGNAFSGNSLSQTTDDNRPLLGLQGKGRVGFSPLFFYDDNKAFMSLDTAITLEDDFTIFIFIENIEIAGTRKYLRLFGKSDDNNMFISIGETANKSYVIGFDASTKTEIISTTTYWNPPTQRVLITLQRKGQKLFIRENGKTLTSGAVSDNDFVFDQIGKKGNDTNSTYNGGIYHLSIYDGYIEKGLEDIEDGIMREANAANHY